MGTDPTTDSYEPGDHCEICKDVIFGGVTPLYVEVLFADVVLCPGGTLDINGVHVLTQWIQPCSWVGGSGGISVFWDMTGGVSNLTAGGGGWSYFSSHIGLPCKTSFTNGQVICGFPRGARFGTGKVFWGPTIGP